MAMILLALYLNFNSGDLTNTSSHMCGSWYLPIFLFRDWSFNLINIASFDGPDNALVLPAHNAEIVQRHLMTSDVMVVTDRCWSLHVLSEPLGKSSARFTNIFFITVHLATPEPVDHSTPLQDGISIFGVYQEVLDGVSPPMFSADVFAALTHALDIWDNYIGLVVIASFVGVINCPLISVSHLLLFDISSA